jgi:hypothetical protein
MSAHFALGRILLLLLDDFSSACLLSQHKLQSIHQAFRTPLPPGPESVRHIILGVLPCTRWLILQKIIHPTPLRSLALFLSYEPSVTHIREPRVRPSAIHDTSDGEPLPGSKPSYIHDPPQLQRHSQKSISVSVSSARVGPSDNLVTIWTLRPDSEVGAP